MVNQLLSGRLCGEKKDLNAHSSTTWVFRIEILTL